ncbi:hypothetical protein [Ralstonia pseudosolanacearum]|uniref:hypothetical protein n=1 Tax=Ralstonia pseudosolanacearum TaxID=1310165 RepID=UPI00048A7409|nr:hypothetical protein [Ralstonia pseudosolanacearum]MDO3559425.1 hypothetical protein [Ralstonia pseudosolanacearum]MDO3579071.1 hypothetical protein [Ralstonia pseudosolanacearum]MDO3588762.1 hypothetical protein [Ralstonia pseudosolanacearum]
MRRTILLQESLVNLQRDTTLSTCAQELDRRDGTTLLVIDQPALQRCALDEPDRVALDEAAQLTLYKHLHTKFSAQPLSPAVEQMMGSSLRPC